MTKALARQRGLCVSAVTAPVLLAVFVLVFASSWCGITLTYYTGRIAAIWLSNAIAIAAVLKARRADYLQILLATFVANILADILAHDLVFRACVLSLANMVEIAIVVEALRRLRLNREFTRPKALLVFYALALGPAPLAAAVMAGGYLHLAVGTGLWRAVGSWYLGDALGLIILVPPLVTVRLRDFATMFSAEERPITLVLLGVLAAVLAVNVIASNYPLPFLFFPIVLLMTFVRGFAGGTIGLFVTVAYLLTPVLFGHDVPAMQGHTVRDQIMIAQIFGAVISFTVVLIGAALEERRRLERSMAEAVQRAEEAREEALVAKDAAETANRTKSMFLANMSHELRTPLNAVIGFSAIMHGEMYGPVGEPKYRDYARLIHDAGAHLLDLINDILDMSKIEAGKFEIERRPVDMSEVVADCVALMQERAAEAGVTLVQEPSQAPVWIQADRRACKQILLNLLSNGVKFTPAGGEVGVGATLRAGRCVLSVRDTGVGIAPQDVRRLGNPFVQLRDGADHTHKGTGLGLALVRALTEMHDGTMRIESRQGAGTTVTIEIPPARSEAAAA